MAVSHHNATSVTCGDSRTTTVDAPRPPRQSHGAIRTSLRVVKVKGDLGEEQIIEIATRLFAELGFDGTSTDMIATATGLDTAALVERTGGKQELYLTVIDRISRAEWAALESALASFTPTTQGLIELTDAYLDFHAANPQVLWVWEHRWMGDAAGTAPMEETHRRPMLTMVADAIRDAVPADVDTDSLIWTIVWCIAGFLSSGILRSHPGARSRRAAFQPDRYGGVDPAELAAFRSYLHVLIRRMSAPESPR